MRSKNIPNPSQLSFFPTLREQLNPKQSLYQLSEMIDWSYFEREFAEYYSSKGRPAHPIRKMVGLLILKSLYNLSDEGLVEDQWEMNVYYQYFTGETVQQWGQPCAASDLVHFRKRVGTSGVEKIFKHSVDLHGKDAEDSHVSVDTTVQEKNITYPTDAKLYSKIIDKCVGVLKDRQLPLRRSYKQTVKELVRATYNSTHPKRRKHAGKSLSRLKTIAGRLYREVDRKLPSDDPFREHLPLFDRVLKQTRNSSNKVYSIDEPQVYCIAKGKAHKKYEYGCKGSVLLTQKTGIIIGAMTFGENLYDGHTLEPVLSQCQRVIRKHPRYLWADRGYKGNSQVLGVEVNYPKPPLKRDSEYQKRKKRKHFRKRAGIEPVIGHLKSDFRVARNYLKGALGDSINFIMGAVAFNLKKLLKKIKNETLTLSEISYFMFMLVWSNSRRYKKL